MALLALLVVAGCASDGPEPPPARTVVRGVVMRHADGSTHLWECGTKKMIQVGSMASNQERHLRRRLHQITARGERQATAELSGYLDRNQDGGVIEKPAVAWVTPGFCTHPKDPSVDYN
jgi:hypothetical protein